MIGRATSALLTLFLSGPVCERHPLIGRTPWFGATIVMMTVTALTISTGATRER